MRRSIAALIFACLAGSATLAQPAVAAFEVAVALSPAEGVVGRPVEVLLRTFAPFDQGQIDLPAPSRAYPAPSGNWNVLYPIADYSFDVVAHADDGTTITVRLSRDPGDGTLWRGSFTPSTAGTWTVEVRNFPSGQPGASADIVVSAKNSMPVIGLVGAAALFAGLFAGFAIGRRHPRRRSLS